MDFDPESPLNRAHRRERLAEDHVKAERFDAAVDCFEKATRESLTLESLRVPESRAWVASTHDVLHLQMISRRR